MFTHRAQGYVGVDSFRYAVCDNQSPVAKCDSEWVYITVLPTGSANTTNAMDDYGQTPNGAKLNGDVKPMIRTLRIIHKQ
ncbi:MAG: hypothetical protein IPK03_06825 [Bacteroidetes bacterium]|nr:hypothetical protein [Bacteroidota bacterium]